MVDHSDENKLRLCLEETIEVVQTAYAQLEFQGRVQEDKSLTNSALDVNIHAFILDKGEEVLMSDLKRNLENVLTNHLPSLSNRCRGYLLDLLYQLNYNVDREEFTNPFNIGIIDSFVRDLECALASLKGFQAAWDGDQPAVEVFIRKYPTSKDKSGIWGTTLLYSAARNNRLELVDYLLRRAKCSVNAQNLQHIVRALSTGTKTDENVDPNPTAGSTALHGACYNGHLDVVKLLLEHGADYFLTNHSDETPIENAEFQAHILQYFRDFLILGYSSTSTELPDTPILEEGKEGMVDCVWEYKPCADQKWFAFSDFESAELQKSLKIKPGQDFKREIHLKVSRGIYSVSIMKFLRSGKGLDQNENLAWVRCRGSSILNFQCYALWQIMFTTYPEGISASSLRMFNIPSVYDSRFRIHLHSWYFCDARTNNELDQTMKYRRKGVDLDVSFTDSGKLTFNLQTFVFSNQDKTIQGFIRWIPKMVSNNSRHQDKVISLDEYETLTNLNPIPLTVSRLKQASSATETILDDNEEVEADDVDDYNNSTIDAVDETPETPLNGPRSLNEIFSTTNSIAINPIPSTSPFNSLTSLHTTNFNLTTDLVLDDEGEEIIADCIGEKAADSRPDQQAPVVESLQPSSTDELSDIMRNQLAELQQEKERILKDLDCERTKVQSLSSAEAELTKKHVEELSQLIERIDKLSAEQTSNQNTLTKLEQIAKTIKYIDYNPIAREIVSDFLTPKYSLIHDHLRQTIPDLDPSFADRIPRMIFNANYGEYIVTVVGMERHHDEFKAVLKRIWSLLNIVQSAKDFYQRNLNRSIRLLARDTLPKVTSRTQIWREYIQIFLRLFKVKSSEYQKQFDEYIQEKMKLLIDSCIIAQLTTPWIAIREDTDDFLKTRSLMSEIESIKQKALEEYIEQNISMQHLKLDREPTAKSIAVVQVFIEKIRNELKTDPKYRGYEIEHFGLIPKLLERLMLYYCCFKTQLPLYGFSEDLLNKIERNAVTTIATSTGSGKSTLLPALLVAEGYDKVIVTQPRRLPCQLICRRVNETMIIDVGPLAEKVAGWAVSGTERNPQAKILYVTDGLLKERLLYDENLITTHTELNKSVIFFIDEVHERSVNIDLCLAFLARLLTRTPDLKNKMKVIISSATLDSSIATLFRHIPQAGLAEFKMPQMGTLYPVKTIPRPNENILDVVQDLCKKRKLRDQILCFVSSVPEVNQCCRLIGEVSRGTIVAYPLVQSQQPNVQQSNIEHGAVFFSTTLAETSLTFPSLKYVVDSGMINTPVYDIESKRTILKEVRAAESTIKQRLGRLGRTQPGEYYSLYSFVPNHVPFPIAQICQSDLTNLEFSLRKSPLKKGLNYIKQFLPDKPSQHLIDTTIAQLQHLRILDNGTNNRFTKHGEALAQLPDFGSLAMSKSVLAALTVRRCGYDLICLSSILGVLNTTTIFKSVPQHLKSPDGDFMTLLNVMNEILLVKQSVATNQFNLKYVCQQKGLGSIHYILRQALRRYETLEKLFNLSDHYREQAQMKSGNWELIAKALLEGYSDNVFVSMKELQDRSFSFVCYNDRSNTTAVLDLQSTLTRPINTAPVSLVLVRDIRHYTAIREKAVLSFAGEIEAEWLEHEIERHVDLTNEEDAYINTENKFSTAQSKFSNRINMQKTKEKVILKGSAGVVLNVELHIRQQIVSELQFSLAALGSTTAHENFERNLKSVMKMIRIFNPMKWRWLAQKQVEITINSNTATNTCDITVKGRDSESRKVKEEFDTFISWLRTCAVIQHPNAGVSPRVLRPQMRKSYLDMEERISRVTDSKRTPIDLYNGTKGTKATRETRMEVVAWIAVCKFDCRLEGGFIRDWVIGRDIQRPAKLTNPQAWIETKTPVPTLNKEVVPYDLDCHLPSHVYFDISKFQDELYKYDIHCSVSRQDWRYVLLFDENETTGPFTMDLIEPHVALTQDRIDFDVSNLTLEKDYTHELGMRIDVTQKPYSIELETIVDNCKNKKFRVLRPMDNFLIQRKEKMIKRGWTEVGEPLSVIPKPHWKHNVVLVPLPRSAVLYTEVSTKMGTIAGVTIVSIEEIRNPFLEETYEGMKKLIEKQCAGANPHEQELFHGTKAEGIEGITEDGFDDRFFNATGMYGHGAYFADNPQKSHGYTTADPQNNNARIMFYAKVLLGNSSILTAANNSLVSAPKGFHSVIGKHSLLTEYIIYRYGQALPYLKITYRA